MFGVHVVLCTLNARMHGTPPVFSFRMLDPSPIVFQSVLNTNITHPTKNAYVAFNNVILNEGKGYSSSTGKFTVPSDGIYVIQWSCKTDPGQKFRTGLVINGVWKVGNYLSSLSIHDGNAASQTYVGLLMKGDEVGIRTYGEETFLSGDMWSAFSGFKL